MIKHIEVSRTNIAANQPYGAIYRGTINITNDLPSSYIGILGFVTRNILDTAWGDSNGWIEMSTYNSLTIWSVKSLTFTFVGYVLYY